MEKMKKNTFKLEFHQKSETWYIIKNVDELTKDHKIIDVKMSLDSCQKTLMIDFVLSEVSKNIYHISIP